ncbi:hypothetical protein TNCV_3918861 [Trichonephila clavipes]|nr:hypothetical protein TNCV_3918861 [Trichonephila clavipes]
MGHTPLRLHNPGHNGREYLNFTAPPQLHGPSALYNDRRSRNTPNRTMAEFFTFSIVEEYVFMEAIHSGRWAAPSLLSRITRKVASLT